MKYRYDICSKCGKQRVIVNVWHKMCYTCNKRRLEALGTTKKWKVFNENLKCCNFQFKVGDTYTHEDNVEICASGFHFHENVKDLFNYYVYQSRV